MNDPINRRDFLKLAGLLPLAAAAPGLSRVLTRPAKAQADAKNVMIVVFDAFSAYNISLYGYRRETTPNLAKLAKRAVVYHNHFAGSNFTTSGTASLLTGTLPWTHRALEPNGEVAEPFVTKNIFGAFNDYYRLAYTHNGWAYTLLKQMEQETNELIPREKLLVASYDNFIESLFRNDQDLATVGWTRDMRITDGYAYSLFLSHLYEVLQEGKIASLKPLFPRGLPTTGSDDGFLLEQAVDWISRLLTAVPQPFLGYFHFLPPHFPYHTSVDFYNRFKGDGYKPVSKPRDVFTDRRVFDDLLARRTEYDEFILYVDREFGRFYDELERSGVLSDTWLVLTSDHGEMFERGIVGHSTDALYQPVIRVPLLIFEPGRGVGADVYTATSAVDILPTLAHVTGHSIPSWVEGGVLPPYAEPDIKRDLYVVRGKNDDPNGVLTQASTTLVRGRYKLHYYYGYGERGIQDFVRLYDIEADPEEMTDLSNADKVVTAELLNELKSKLKEVNKPYLLALRGSRVAAGNRHRGIARAGLPTTGSIIVPLCDDPLGDYADLPSWHKFALHNVPLWKTVQEAA
jgi:arylsulfatase A-like enzyme